MEITYLILKSIYYIMKFKSSDFKEHFAIITVIKIMVIY